MPADKFWTPITHETVLAIPRDVELLLRLGGQFFLGKLTADNVWQIWSRYDAFDLIPPSKPDAYSVIPQDDP